MAAQRRSLLQSVRNRPALRAGGWEPEGGLSGAGAAPSPPLGRLLLPGEVWPPPSPLPGRPPSLPRPGARATARGPRVRAAARSSGAGIRGPATPSVKGASRVGSVLEPEGKVARCGGAGRGGEATPGSERPWHNNSDSRGSRLSSPRFSANCLTL